VEPQEDEASLSARKVDAYWAEKIAAARRESDARRSASAERDGARQAKASRSMWAWVLGLPPLFIAAVVASIFVHDPATEAWIGLGGGKSEWALLLVGFWLMVIWFVGCLFLLIRALVREARR
jgi:hypothetical protein